MKAAFLVILSACAAARPAAYEADLVACTESSRTRQESLDCENRVRAQYGRPQIDAGKDGAQ